MHARLSTLVTAPAVAAARTRPAVSSAFQPALAASPAPYPESDLTDTGELNERWETADAYFSPYMTPLHGGDTDLVIAGWKP